MMEETRDQMVSYVMASYSTGYAHQYDDISNMGPDIMALGLFIHAMSEQSLRVLYSLVHKVDELSHSFGQERVQGVVGYARELMDVTFEAAEEFWEVRDSDEGKIVVADYVIARMIPVKIHIETRLKEGVH